MFGYEVGEGDEDTDGVSIEAGRIALNGGTIEDEAENAAELDHGAVADASGAQGGRGQAEPAERGGGWGLSDADLRGGARRGVEAGVTGDFTVEVDGQRAKRYGSVGKRERVVTLTLNPAVEHGDTGIRVSYAVPTGVGANPIQDEVGNDARGLSNQSVTNTTGAPNTAPADHESEFVRRSGEPVGGEAAGGEGHRRGGRGDGLGDRGRGRPVAVCDHLRYGRVEFPGGAGLTRCRSTWRVQLGTTSTWSTVRSEERCRESGNWRQSRRSRSG